MAPCDAAMTFADYMVQFEFIKAMTCGYFTTAGMFATGALVYGGISLSLYIRTGSAVIPFVLLLLTGGAVLSQVAPPVITIATIVFLVVAPGVVAYAYYQYSR